MQKYKFITRVQNPKVKIFLFFIFFLTLLTDSKAQSNLSTTADSLFISQNYTEAAEIYEEILDSKEVNSKNINLKLAYIYENKADYPRALYHLNSYYNLSPSDELFEKMYKLALINQYKGYDRNNLNFLFAIYQQYYFFILYGFILLGISFWIYLALKRKRKQPIYSNHIALAILSLLLIGVIINFPSVYSSAIVKNKTYLRDHPSLASPIINDVEPGNKISIFGNGEIWTKAYIDKKIVYVNKEDLWILD